MNVISSAFIPQTPFSIHESRPVREADRKSENQQSENQQSVTRTSRIKEDSVFRVSPGLSEKFRLNEPSSASSSTKSLLLSSPSEQYQTNQDLLRREAVESLLSIDLFA